MLGAVILHEKKITGVEKKKGTLLHEKIFFSDPEAKHFYLLNL